MKEHSGKHHPMVVEATLEPQDPRVTAVLREVVGEPPYQLVDWDALRASIVGDAASLFTRRVRRSWTAYVVRWSRMTMPVGIAASVIAGFVTIYASRTTIQNVATDEVSLSPATVLNAVTGVTSRTALAATVTQPLSGVRDTDLLGGLVP